jgi:hypothetical protein
MDATPSYRRTLYAILITVVAGAVAGRVLSTPRLGDPTYSDNDRSRWDTVRALVDHGTYAIGHREDDPASSPKYKDSGIVTEEGWKTIDKVLQPDTHNFYSSKPPFLATLVAGEYWLLKKAFGWSITQERWAVVRVSVLTINGLPFIVYLLLLSRLLEVYGKTDWGRFYVFAAAGFGTLLTTFVTVLNNHSVATCTALFALYAALRIWSASEPRPWHFMAAGFFAAFTAACELPAMSFLIQLFLFLLYRSPRRTLLWFVPAAALPVAAFLWTNYLAVGQLRPAYGEFGGPWYEYEGSHWKIDPLETKRGIDWAYQVEGPADYAFNMLFGHHGIFSLSPIYLLTLAGIIYVFVNLSRRNSADPERNTPPGLRMLAFLTLILSVIVICFYIF